MTRIKNTDAAPEDLATRAKSGPHKGWNTFDEKFEGSRYQLLQELVSSEVFDSDHATVVLSELEDYAQSYGYGCADSALHSFGHLTEDELDEDENVEAKIIMDELFENDGESDSYFHEVLNSEKALKEAARTPEALNFLGFNDTKRSAYGTIWATVNSAFIRGRDMKKEEYETVKAPRP